ncbi:MAG: sulfide/dihydroorotate dehydrogenase-like FAD/NAD-binding protein [Candidatus Heimdallarchaeum aukensis]|uniref:Sulfide/dihydroorotate dehydrogenase-like FAD/NAD-binding protein n=1 Tax=Candidatus Heimdallarchaeum aukensis TaxID=2876573 RepID=A0A9Y1FL58_9ARCH|nr:MAG: sulfide/dihydroorotate dehydrogenase-like FAD/NAD-binding protein [Candidatus Heimdallarchaeum aukensis]
MSFEILDTRELNSENTWMKIKAPLIAERCKAGQFVIIRANEKGERIPLTIANWDKEEGSFEVVFQKVGASTLELGTYKKGDLLLDVVGPLGIPTHTEGAGNTVVIGGGLGIAIATPVARAYKEAGNKVHVIIGARTKELLFNIEILESFADGLTICTDDGSFGIKGFVTQPLQEMIDKGEKIDTVFCVGPPIMMKFISKITEKHGIHTVASLNTIMLDGTGMCGACRVTVGDEIKFVCVDGPDFDAHLVDWDEMMARTQAYREEEKIALEHYHKCRAEKALEEQNAQENK